LIMKTAIIGLGNIGARLARNFARGGSTMILADRTVAKAEALAADIGATATAMTVADAIGEADGLILSISFDAIKSFISQPNASLVGKLVVDPSNPIAPDGKGGFRKVISAEQSAGETIAGLLPGGVRLVKAFGTLGAESLAAGAFRSPHRAVLFYATDDRAAGETVAALISASGFDPVSVGGIDQSLRIEVGGDLHEFGKLGRLVSDAEARALI
jgi:8-hydroxy-5-deazaflavin:NADPH oxidoreductase